MTIILVLFYIMATIFAVIAVIDFVFEYRIKKQLSSTTGHILSIPSPSPKTLRQNSLKKIKVGYTVKGEYYESDGWVKAPMYKQAGDTIKIRYYTIKPEKTYSKYENRHIVFVLLALGCVLIPILFQLAH